MFFCLEIVRIIEEYFVIGMEIKGKNEKWVKI